jgi:aspartyl-tRNA(Asn)/glutamyl-tRNA(Gln) amidotransferase subunit A
MSELCWMSAVKLAREIRSRRISPVEALEAMLAQIERVEPRVRAFITLVADEGRAKAREAETAITRGDELGLLHGVPVAVKDMHLTAGLRTTMGSKLYEHFVPNFDAPIVARLRQAGAVIVGKTNTSEFGLVPLAANSIVGDSHNPWSHAHNTGGSSGGSAAAVASGMCPIATGSDGGGSIRIPAAFCGVFGLKPHMGRIPHIHWPRGWESLSHQGVLTRSVEDTALALDALGGPLREDRYSLPAADRSFLEACQRDVKGLRLAWLPAFGGLPVEPEVAEVCARAARKFEDLGCVVEEIALDLPDLGPAQQVIVLCETAASIGERREEWQRVVYPPTSRMLTKADDLDYYDLIRAHWTRDEFWEKFSPLYEKYDAVLTPTSSIAAPENGSLGPREIAGQRIRSLAWLGYCVPFNMTWQPAASVPAGFTAAGLPVGLQVVGDRFDEQMVLRLSAAYQRANDWTRLRPPVCAGDNLGA